MVHAVRTFLTAIKPLFGSTRDNRWRRTINGSGSGGKPGQPTRGLLTPEPNDKMRSNTLGTVVATEEEAQRRAPGALRNWSLPVDPRRSGLPSPDPAEAGHKAAHGAAVLAV